MTIGLFHPAFQTMGGAEILVATWARYFERSGQDVSIVTLALDVDRWRDWLDGIHVRITPKAAWFETLLSRVRRYERMVPRVEACLSDCATVLACNFPTNALLGASSVAARRLWYCTEPSRDFHVVATNPTLDARVRATPGGPGDAEREYAWRLARYERSIARGSWRADVIAYDVENTKKLDTILAISEYGRDSVARVYGRTDATIVYPIVRFPAERARPRAGIDRTGLKILTHSRLEVPKNIDLVVRAFALLSGKVPGSELHVVGEGAHRKSLEKLARDLGVSRGAKFHGYLPEKELARIYDACDVFALLPLDEPFGMVFPEAAARGLLLVGPDHGGPFEILDGGRLGFACDPFDPEALAETFQRIARLSDAEADARRAAADRACRSRYSEEVMGPELLRALGRTDKTGRRMQSSG